MNDEIESLRRQLLQLKELHAAGVLDTQRYDESRVPLERRLVDAVTAGAALPTAAPAVAAAAVPVAAAGDVVAARAPRPSSRLIIGMTTTVLLVAALGYGWTGAPALINPSAAARAPAAADGAAGAAPAGQAEAEVPTAEQVTRMVETLSKRLKERPDDAQGWTMLARAYAALGRTAEAVPAFQKAVTLNTADAGLLADYADSLAVQNNRQLNGEPLKLVERALKIEPGNLKALALAGTAAFDRKDFAGAVKYWEQLKLGVPGDSAYLGQVQAGIDEARQLGKLPPAAGAPAAAPAAAGGNASIFAPGNSVSGRVTLASALAGQASPDDTVFVFARAAEGSRMPLAILRKQVRDLPFDFQLDDSMAMSPAAKLSGAPSVIVGARVSKTGEAMPQNGDLTGQSAPVAPGATGLKIEIGEVVKK
jgi:cytochrome c-type biogenesis protein CcmH